MPPKTKPAEQPLCSTCTQYAGGACRIFQIHLKHADPDADGSEIVTACTHYTRPQPAKETT